MQKFIHSSKNGGFAYCYLAPQVDARIAELEQQLVGANQTIALFMGPDGEQHIERFAALVKRPGLCEMEPPDVSHDLSNGVVCIGCWNELAHRAGKQAVALESMSDRIAELERVLRNVREHNECPDCAAEISKALMER